MKKDHCIRVTKGGEKSVQLRLVTTKTQRLTAVETLARRIGYWQKFPLLWTWRLQLVEASSLAKRLCTINDSPACGHCFPPALQLAIMKMVCNAVNTTARYQHKADKCPFHCGVVGGDSIQHFAVCRAVAKAASIILPGLMPSIMCEQPLRSFLGLEDSATGDRLAAIGLILDAVIAAHAAARHNHVHSYNDAVAHMRARASSLARSHKCIGNLMRLLNEKVHHHEFDCITLEESGEEAGDLSDTSSTSGDSSSSSTSSSSSFVKLSLVSRSVGFVHPE